MTKGEVLSRLLPWESYWGAGVYNHLYYHLQKEQKYVKFLLVPAQALYKVLILPSFISQCY